MFTPFYTPLMDINVLLPSSCTYTFDFSKSFKSVKIQEASAFVNDIYAKCLSKNVEYSNQTKTTDERIEIKLAIGSGIFASIPSGCTYTFEYTEENKFARVDDAASFVSEVFSRFPTLTDEEKKKLGESRLSLDRSYGTVKGAKEFKKSLKERIVKDLTNERSIKLSTDNIPEGVLLEVARSVLDVMCFIGLFPCKSATYVTLMKKEIEVRMHF